MSTVIQPSILVDMAAHDYHAGPEASKGRLAILRNKSPRHLAHSMTTPTEATEAMKMGTLVHTLTLQPHLIAAEYVVAPARCEGITGKGTQCANAPSRLFADKWLCGVHSKGMTGRGDDTRQTIAEDVMAQAVGMRDALLANRYARELLKDAACEVSWFWTEDGIACRARPDIWHAGLKLIGDIKTTDDASPVAFQRQLLNQSYDLQAAHYLSGADHVGLTADAFLFLVVERNPPHAVGIYRVTDKTLLPVAEERRRLLQRYGECQQYRTVEEFPDYGSTIQNIDLSDWAIRKIEAAASDEAEAA